MFVNIIIIIYSFCIVWDGGQKLFLVSADLLDTWSTKMQMELENPGKNPI